MSDLPQFKSQYIDITGGIDSAAHVREQRDDWAPVDWENADTDQLTPAEDSAGEGAGASQLDGGAWWLEEDDNGDGDY
jgi:hypothetical protein